MFMERTELNIWNLFAWSSPLPIAQPHFQTDAASFYSADLGKFGI